MLNVIEHLLGEREKKIVMFEESYPICRYLIEHCGIASLLIDGNFSQQKYQMQLSSQINALWQYK